MGQLTTDLDLTPARIAKLSSADALAEFFTALRYRTDARQPLSPEAIGLAGDAAAPIRDIEVLAEDADGFMRVVFVRLRSLTAKSRNDLVRVLGRTNVDHLLVMTSDFGSIEFVLLDKRRRENRGPTGGQRIQVVPLVFAVDRKGIGTKELRTLRRFTWTGRDGLEQFDKLRSVFEAAAFTEDYFCNRALFADHYLVTRLREDPVWRESPTQPFQQVRELLKDARQQWLGKGEQTVRDELYEPVFKLLGFRAQQNKQAGDDQTIPDYLLIDAAGKTVSAAFTYAWDRWLDGPDYQQDQNTPDENPGACVVTALEQGVADWIMVTNGRQWRLYSRHAHSRATNFYEVDLPETLIASGDTDPNEAFRYWWLFFRSGSYISDDGAPPKCWLDRIAEESSDYARELGERLKGRIFEKIFPHLARGFLQDRQQRLGLKQAPTEDDLRDVFQGTLTLLYRLLFLLYAESRDLLPVREAPYHEASLKKLKQEIAEAAGIAQSEVDVRIEKHFSAKETSLYDRLQRLFAVMDLGDAALNVPTYNGGLFLTRPENQLGADSTQERELHIARFLAAHKVPDRALALAIDLLSRDEDPKTFKQVFIDYKSLAVRHLGSIYEGLLEFKLKIADEDLTTQTEKGKDKFIPLSAAKAKRGRGPEVVVGAGEVYLSNDKAERKASGSYYTPDPIVEYIVEQTVGPVLAEKLETLRPQFRKVRKTFDNEVQKATAFPVRRPDGTFWEPREFALEKVYATHKDLVEDLFEFRTLDPAMGSGHFLVEAVDFLTDRLITFLNQFPINPVQVMLEQTRRNILVALGEQGVTVDPAKLTDVNLLKRHVLKRCIYGVDLNPMAVELAKVSLWLDAFTLGAPLSFLNHHLRCGNSLIGATFADLTRAIKGRLFGVDYEPLLRAIRHVLFVNKMSDATAAEVKASAAEYDQARSDLSGYQVVLDLLVAQHFGLPEAPKIFTHMGTDIDLSSRQKFQESLSLFDRSLLTEIRTVAQQPELLFFHWEIEFPEVFFAFADADQRRLLHKNEITAGSAGFDAVVGNPPYVRQETIKPLKEYLKTCFATFNSANDLYVYFQEREISVLRSGCRMGMIVSNKWMRAGYGEKVREFLKLTAQPVDLIDFGHTPIFPDADTFPCVLIAARRAKPVKDVAEVDSFRACPIPRADWHTQMDLVGYCRAKGYALPTRLMRSDVWSLENPALQHLLEQIRGRSSSLRARVGAVPESGIKTGFNDAYLLSEQQQARIIAASGTAKDLIRPMLRGRDMDRWHPHHSTVFLITIASSENRDWPWSDDETRAEAIFRKCYPSIYQHLLPFKTALEQRQDQGRYWWELRSCDYMPAFDRPKIVWQEMAWFTRFAVDEESHVLNNTGYILPTTDPVVIACLNSPVAWWYMWRTAQHGKDEVLRLIKSYVTDFPIPVKSSVDDEIASVVASLREQTHRIHAWEEDCVEAFSKFGVAADVDRVIDWLPLSEETFVTRATRLLENTSTATRPPLVRFQAKYRAEQLELLNRKLVLEREVARLVEDAYGLTPEERQLLHATRPIRDPLDVLESKIAGRAEDVVAPADVE